MKSERTTLLPFPPRYFSVVVITRGSDSRNASSILARTCVFAFFASTCCCCPLHALASFLSFCFHSTQSVLPVDASNASTVFLHRLGFSCLTLINPHLILHIDYYLHCLPHTTMYYHLDRVPQNHIFIFTIGYPCSRRLSA
jgi:hypothetical protein